MTSVLEMRDRIHAIDEQMMWNTEERLDLIRRIRAEGFELTSKVTDELLEKKKDPSVIQAGDSVKFTDGEWGAWFTENKPYVVVEVDMEDNDVKLVDDTDDVMWVTMNRLVKV